MSHAQSSPSPLVRTRDSARAKDAILRAAVMAFATRGFTQASVREIAAAAGYAPALVLRYYRSKQELFEAALEEALKIDRLTTGERRTFGVRAAQILSQPTPYGATSTTILAIADPHARQTTAKLVERRVIDELSQWLGGEEARTRAALITALCTGFAIYRHFLPVSALAKGADGAALDWLATSLQALVDGTPETFRGVHRQDSAPL